METIFRIRKATLEDVPVLTGLIDSSVRGLQTEDYSPAQMEAALQTVFGVDSQLIADETFLVAETNASVGGGQSPSIIAGCGGWSQRKTLYGGDRWMNREDSLLDPAHDAAKIRAFFVHPSWARQGLGTLILNACEGAAKLAGFTRCEMGATLTGVKLFQARGYRPVESFEIPLSNGISLPIVRMAKQL